MEHFKGKDPLAHVIEAHRDGIITSSEMHGLEVSGHWVALIDTLRDTLIFTLLVYTPLYLFGISQPSHLKWIAFSGIGWIIWRVGRSALLGWSRLERLHRIVEQERWEIEHHRQQERDELKELYRAKGFEGKLLDDVIDVLMADGDRLLRVMIEEELGLSLEVQEHPLKQALGALAGGLIALMLFLMFIAFLPPLLILIATSIVLIAAGYAAAVCNQNEKVPSVMWHLGLGLLSFGVTYFLMVGFNQ
jgi:hypothetical protein